MPESTGILICAVKDGEIVSDMQEDSTLEYDWETVCLSWQVLLFWFATAQQLSLNCDQSPQKQWQLKTGDLLHVARVISHPHELRFFCFVFHYGVK